MATSTAQKLKIKPGMILRTINAPAAFEKHIGALPEGVKISATAKNYDQLHWFVPDKAQLEKDLDNVLAMVSGEVSCYIYYPKGTSKIQTDLTRDKGWEKLLAKDDVLTWISLISFDDTWSAFGFRPKTAADRRKEEKPKERAVLDYADPATKTVRLPEDLAQAMKKSKQAAAVFEVLSFTNKKEYVEWVVTARRATTRAERVKGTIERLEMGWKNPRNQ
jgi:hypothetical protein